MERKAKKSDNKPMAVQKKARVVLISFRPGLVNGNNRGTSNKGNLLIRSFDPAMPASAAAIGSSALLAPAKMVLPQTEAL